ncbi:Hint domain-containing protein [Roseovarius sp. EL26]|uniref:Hint domain-containing protein n=1 Tax=Roseovarius sp. EL26 TaxID=2126672 RepID=UPI0020B10EA6|nr:Hint domain-containing protein [Roseovarius sp. EL26]
MPDPYFSELKYLGGASLDFIEVAVDAGTDISDLEITIYFSDGTIRSTNTLVGITPTTIAGKDVYVIDTSSSGTFNGLALSNAVSLSDSSDGTVFSFVSFTDTAAAVTATEGPANGLTSTEIGGAGSGSSLESTDGSSYTLQTNPTPGSVPCFTSGTMIAVPGGTQEIGQLTHGDVVLTKDRALQPIRWIGRRKYTAEQLDSNPKLRPVRIMAGALGQGLPERDVLVSRQHRMLLQSKIAKRMFGKFEVLIPAIKLTELPGIFVDEIVQSVEYIHLLFDQHEIIYAEGTPTESLFTGPEALKSISPEACQEILSIFPEVKKLDYRPKSARFIPSGKGQKQLIARHLKNCRPCISQKNKCSQMF